jgi:molecular chaperone GrpE
LPIGRIIVIDSVDLKNTPFTMQNTDDNPMNESEMESKQTDGTDITTEPITETTEKTDAEKNSDQEQKINELNDKYLRLYSEFDNYRKRTNKEKIDTIKTASEDVLKAILPILDDMERAIKANESLSDAQSIKEGLQLIFNKFKNITQQKGLFALDSKGEVFNPDLMEAITHIPASNESEKGKVIDEIEKGYKLGEKVIRFAKVVIAQ